MTRRIASKIEQERKHREIATRYEDAARRRGAANSRIVFRLSGLKKTLWRRHHPERLAEVLATRKAPWPSLPDNAEARWYLRLIADTVAAAGWRRPDDRFVEIARDAAPWLAVAERAAIWGAVRQRYTAITFGKALRLTDAERTELRITTIWPIDVPRSRMIPRRNERQAARERARRAAQKAAKGGTKTERAVSLLQDLLRHRPLGVASILRIAAREGLERPGARTPGTVLRKAAQQLGVTKAKTALNEGWQWALAVAKTPSPGARKPLVFPKASTCADTTSKTPVFSEGVQNRVQQGLRSNPPPTRSAPGARGGGRPPDEGVRRPVQCLPTRSSTREADAVDEGVRRSRAPRPNAQADAGDRPLDVVYGTPFLTAVLAPPLTFTPPCRSPQPATATLGGSAK